MPNGKKNKEGKEDQGEQERILSGTQEPFTHEKAPRPKRELLAPDHSRSTLLRPGDPSGPEEKEDEEKKDAEKEAHTKTRGPFGPGFGKSLQGFRTPRGPSQQVQKGAVKLHQKKRDQEEEERE